MISTSHGVKFQLVINNDSMDFTAPIPSNTAPKQSAARIIHINIHEIPSVLRIVASKTLQFNLLFAMAAIVAAVAPTAELSTKLVIPIMNKPVIKKKIKNGVMPALNTLSFSLKGMLRSSTLKAGARLG